MQYITAQQARDKVNADDDREKILIQIEDKINRAVECGKFQCEIAIYTKASTHQYIGNNLQSRGFVFDQKIKMTTLAGSWSNYVIHW